MGNIFFLNGRLPKKSLSIGCQPTARSSSTSLVAQRYLLEWLLWATANSQLLSTADVDRSLFFGSWLGILPARLQWRLNASTPLPIHSVAGERHAYTVSYLPPGRLRDRCPRGVIGCAYDEARGHKQARRVNRQNARVNDRCLWGHF
jgi:hypothetical protein